MVCVVCMQRLLLSSLCAALGPRSSSRHGDEHGLQAVRLPSRLVQMLIFFLKGRLMTRYLFMRQHLATLDTYFLINCK